MDWGSVKLKTSYFMVILTVIGLAVLMTWGALQVIVLALVLLFFSWSSKKQEVIAQSTAEAEYIAATAVMNQAIWIRKLMVDLQMEQKESTQILVDNQAAISIAKNHVFHGKTKHFKLKLYFLKEVQREVEIQLIYCKTENQNADILNVRPRLLAQT